MYQPLKMKGRPMTKFATSTMPRKGMNVEDTSQLLSMDYALNLMNYIPKRYGLQKRAGLENIFERVGANPITLLKEYRTGVWVIGYAGKIEIYDTNISTWYTLKDDFSAGDGFDGDDYGDYFITTNGVERPYRLSMTLAYDTQTANFATGLKMTGATSGATATILEDTDAGATGTLTIGNIVGVFQDDEIITDSATGSATVNGVLVYAITELSNAPICGGIKIIGARCFAFRLEEDQSAVQFCDIDDGSNPPFDDWNKSTAVDEGGSANYRNAGTARTVVQLGPATVVFSDNGFYAFLIHQLDSAGTLKKIEVIQNYTEDYGGARGAIETPVGVFYMNEAGLWQMVAAGQTDVPMSKQQYLTSTLLGSKYFAGINQTSADLVHDVNQNCILITCAKNSAFNNLIIGMEMDLKAFFTFKNWNINRFAKSGQTIYGASSIKTSVYKCFDGYADDGFAIGTECYYEVPMNGLFFANQLDETYIAGLLSPSSELSIIYDIYNLDGDFEAAKETYLWSANTGSSESYDEWGSAEYGSAFGGAYKGSDTDGLVESFAGGSPRISNFQRLRIKIKGEDQLPHILTWMNTKITQKGAIKRRNLVKSD